MKPAFLIDLRDPSRALAQQNDLLNRDAARSHSIVTAIPMPQVLTATDVSYLPITTPIESGVTVRRVQIIASSDYRIARIGGSVRVAVGLRTADRFEVIGREWDSKRHELVAGAPFDLVTDEQPIRVGIGFAVRVTRSGWPDRWPINAAVETTVGYDPGA